MGISETIFIFAWLYKIKATHAVVAQLAERRVTSSTLAYRSIENQAFTFVGERFFILLSVFYFHFRALSPFIYCIFGANLVQTFALIKLYIWPLLKST